MARTKVKVNAYTHTFFTQNDGFDHQNTWVKSPSSFPLKKNAKQRWTKQAWKSLRINTNTDFSVVPSV